MTARMTEAYLLPHGTPLYWQNETSGTLGAAMTAYINHAAGHPDAPTEEQFALVRAYLEYVVNAPCWHGEEMPILRAQIIRAASVDDLNRFIVACLETGIDPL